MTVWAGTATLALLLGSAAADSVPVVSPAIIEGHVADRTGAPMTYVNAVVLGTKLGAPTDEHGDYRIGGIPPGRVIVRVLAIGYPSRDDTLSVGPGEVRQLVHVMDPYPHVPINKVRLNPELRKRMARASTIRIVRLGSEITRGAPPDSLHFVGWWRISGDAPSQPKGWRRALGALLSERRLYYGVANHLTTLCEFEPGLAVLFRGDVPATDFVVCYHCGEFYVASAGGLRQGGDFDGRGAEFLDLARRAFPDDSTLRALDPSRYRGLLRTDP